MRTIAMLLLAAALAKVGLVLHLRHEGARDVIVAAYGARAVAACEAIDSAFRLVETRASAIATEFGDRNRSVALWQVDHGDWTARFRSVTLVLSTDDGRVCRYDVATGQAKRDDRAAQTG
jgi:hypothetical protein